MNVHAQKIVEACAEHWGYTPEQLLGRDRFPDIVEARHMAMSLLRARRGYSYPQIGKMLQRDHSTVMAACARANMWYQNSVKWRQARLQIETRLSADGRYDFSAEEAQEALEFSA